MGNLLTNPTAFDNAAWVKGQATVTPDATTDPFGGTRADKLVEDTTNAQHVLSNLYTGRGNVQAAMTFSVYLKAAGRSVGTLYLTDDTGFAVQQSNLTTGATVLQFLSGSGVTNIAGGAVDSGNGWWRVWVSALLPASTSNTRVYLFIDNNSGYLGDGTSGIYAFGAVLETGPSPTGATRYRPNYKRMGNIFA